MYEIGKQKLAAAARLKAPAKRNRGAKESSMQLIQASHRDKQMRGGVAATSALAGMFTWSGVCFIWDEACDWIARLAGGFAHPPTGRA